ncbi:MAG: 1-phosphofructokinase family hexose kinase [Acidobacteria bacterium]|nr:1-phosphofructokinase family hexose kinase [Acidobacteriota bacterium]
MLREKYILIVSLNTAIDRIIYLPNFQVATISRANKVVEQAGGKAINVARALVALGHKVLVIGFAGGLTGQQIREDLVNSHIPCSLISISGRSRNCYIFVDQALKQETVVNEPGPEITPQEFEKFTQELSRSLASAEMLICSGSLPKGVPFNSYQQFVELANKNSIPAIVDATGETLKLALQAKPYLIKPNHPEAEQLLDKKFSPLEALDAAREIYNSGVKLGLISLGDSGAVGVWDSGEIFLPAPKIEAINSVACGDAFLAGCASAILSGQSGVEIIRSAIAAGTANALVGGANITRSEFERIKKLC